MGTGNFHGLANHWGIFNYGKTKGVKQGVKQGRNDLQEEIDKKTEETEEYKNSTTKRRAEFEALNLEKVNYVKSLLLIVYGLLVLWFIYVMYKNTDLKRQQKGLLVGGLVAFPFIGPVLLIYIYEMIAYIVALMTGEIYKKSELQ